VDRGKYQPMTAKLPHKGRGLVTWPTFLKNFLGPPSVSRMNKARLFKFGMSVERGKY